MIHSEEINEVAAALSKAQSALEHAAKDRYNPGFKSKYADLAGVVDTIKPVLADNDLAVVQGFVPSAEGVTIETRILHKSGQWIGDEGLFIPADKKNAQGFGSAATYGRRYSLMALVGVAPDDDDDGNAASAPKPARQSAAKPPTKTVEKLVSPEQAAELTAAAIANGIDPALAERTARNTPADRFVVALTKLKEKTNVS